MKKSLLLIILSVFFFWGSLAHADTFSNDEIDRIQKIQENYQEAQSNEIKMYEDIFIKLPKSGPELFELGEINQQALANATNQLNYVRNLSGLAPVTFDKNYSDISQYGAIAMASVRKMTHYLDEEATKPENMTDVFWNAAVKATSEGNLSRTGENSINYIIDRFMEDPAVPSVGHRSWFLSPRMTKFGFGFASTPNSNPMMCYSSFYVRDIANSVPKDFTTSWPNGLFPKNQRTGDWSIHFNPSDYVFSQNEITVTMTDNQTGEKISFSADSATNPLEVTTGYGYLRTIIFRPKNTNKSNGASYHIKVEGFRNNKAPYEYNVKFFE